MIELDTTQRAALEKSRFFARVAEFVRARSPVQAFREATFDKPLLDRLWSPHWPRLRESSPHDAAVFMAFLLACATLRMDVVRAIDAISQSLHPDRSMKLFLSERGLLGEGAFDDPAWPTSPSPSPSH